MPATSSHSIWAIVLAAGISSRMGKPKLLMPWGDHTMIEEVVDQVVAAEYDGIVVVLGEWWEEMQECLDDRDVKFARNLNFRSGVAGSIKAGVAFLDSTATAFAIVLGDQPNIKAKTHKLVMANFRKAKKGVCVPVYDGVIGHPVIFSAEYRSRMFGLQGDSGARRLVEGNKDDLAQLELKAPEIVGSINTQNDYDSQMKQE